MVPFYRHLALGLTVAASMTLARDALAPDPSSAYIVGSAEGDFIWTADFHAHSDLHVALLQRADLQIPPLWEGTFTSDASGYILVTPADHRLDFQPGNLIVISDGIIEKSLLLELVTVDLFDTELDLMGGSAPANTDIEVTASLSEHPRDQGIAVVRSSPQGEWIVDYRQFGIDIVEDMRPWSFAHVYDSDGDTNESGTPAVDPGGPPPAVLEIRTDTVLETGHYGEIVIAADSVTLDCNGQRVMGPGQPSGITIVKRSDVTVHGCHLIGFVRGILVDQSSDVTLLENTAERGEWGVWVTLSSGIRAEGNRADDNRAVGFYLGGTTDSTLVENTAHNNGGNGFGLHDSDENIFSGNRATFNGSAGYFLDLSHRNLLQDNLARANSTGYSLVSSSHNTLVSNHSEDNGSSGYELNEVGTVYMADNSALENGEDSVSVRGRTSILRALRSALPESRSQLRVDALGEDGALENSAPAVSNAIQIRIPSELSGALLLLVVIGSSYLIAQRLPSLAFWERKFPNQDRQRSLSEHGPSHNKRFADGAAVPQFGQADVEDALRHIHDLAYLGSNPIAALQIVRRRIPDGEARTHVDLGRAAQQVLREAIEKFKPTDQIPSHDLSPAWHQFMILHESYLMARLNREVMSELYISEGTFNRRRRDAIQALTRLLAEWERSEDRTAVNRRESASTPI